MPANPPETGGGVELLPCPHCGEEGWLMLPTCRPETPYNPADRLFPIVQCKECYAQVPGNNEDYKGGTAITAWNARSTPSLPSEGEVEAVARAIERDLCAEADRSIGSIWADTRGRQQMLTAARAAITALRASEAEPFGYWVEQKNAEPVLLRKPAYIPEPSDLRTVTPLYARTAMEDRP